MPNFCHLPINPIQQFPLSMLILGQKSFSFCIPAWKLYNLYCHIEGDSKSKQDFQRLYAKLEGWRINADKKISSKKSGYGLMRARSNLVSEEALKLSELAANRDAYKAEEKHYLVRNIIFKVTFHNCKILQYTFYNLFVVQ